VRKVFLDEAGLDLASKPADLDVTLGEALLCPTRIYVRALRRLAASGLMKGAAHITGGGLVDNPTRMFPAGAKLKLQIDMRTWQPPPVFAMLARLGRVAPEEMRRTFNMGIGMIVAVPAGAADAAQSILGAGRRKGLHHRLRPALGRGGRARGVHRMKTGVLASGSGTNLQALIDAWKSGTWRPPSWSWSAPTSLAVSPSSARKRPASKPSCSRTRPSPRARISTAPWSPSCASAESSWWSGRFHARAHGSRFLDAFPLRVINIHPALCPRFPAPTRRSRPRLRRQAGRLHRALRGQGHRHRPHHRPSRGAGPARRRRRQPGQRILGEEHRLLPAVVRAVASGKSASKAGACTLYPAIGVADARLRSPGLG
jgi:hypothetical protein